MGDNPKKKRRFRIQFSLRSLLVLMMVVGGPVGWKLHRTMQQKEAVAWVREHGGNVQYEYQSSDSKVASLRLWLIKHIDVDFFDEVVSVNLTNSEVTELSPLRRLKSVRRLRLAYTSVADLSPLSGLTRMRDLDLCRTKVADLSSLRGMRGLRRLNLDHTRVTDLRPLAELRSLEGFYCRHTTIADLTPLRLNTNIWSLNLTGSKVTDLSVLHAMPRLKNLDLRATAVTDLSPLSGATNLRHLDIFDTPITDLSHLAGTTDLNIELGGSALKELLPLEGMSDATLCLYKYPEEAMPQALVACEQQVVVRPIFKRYGED